MCDKLDPQFLVRSDEKKVVNTNGKKAAQLFDATRLFFKVHNLMEFTVIIFDREHAWVGRPKQISILFRPNQFRPGLIFDPQKF